MGIVMVFGGHFVVSDKVVSDYNIAENFY